MASLSHSFLFGLQAEMPLASVSVFSCLSRQTDWFSLVNHYGAGLKGYPLSIYKVMQKKFLLDGCSLTARPCSKLPRLSVVAVLDRISPRQNLHYSQPPAKKRRIEQDKPGLEHKSQSRSGVQNWGLNRWNAGLQVMSGKKPSVCHGRATSADASTASQSISSKMKR